MKLVKWEFNELTIGMIEDEDGELYCTTRAISSALGVPKQYLKEIRKSNQYEFSLLPGDGLLRGGKYTPKDFLMMHREDLDIKRIRSDMHLWSEDAMLTFAFHVKSGNAIQFRAALRQFIKQNAKKSYVSKDVHEALTEDHRRLEQKVSQLENLVMMSVPAARELASGASKMLRLQRGTKQLREETLH